MGKLFAIEGTDGSGKQTQFNKLYKKLKENNIDFRTVSFPNYESDSSALVNDLDNSKTIPNNNANKLELIYLQSLASAASAPGTSLSTIFLSGEDFKNYHGE